MRKIIIEFFVYLYTASLFGVSERIVNIRSHSSRFFKETYIVTLKNGDQIRASLLDDDSKRVVKFIYDIRGYVMMRKCIPGRFFDVFKMLYNEQIS